MTTLFIDKYSRPTRYKADEFGFKEMRRSIIAEMHSHNCKSYFYIADLMDIMDIVRELPIGGEIVFCPTSTWGYLNAPYIIQLEQRLNEYTRKLRNFDVDYRRILRIRRTEKLYMLDYVKNKNV